MLTMMPVFGQTSYADTDEYPLWVGGTRVTRDNASDIPATVGTKTGRASYNAETKTLTLDGYTYEGEGCSNPDKHPAAIYTKKDDLTIELIGNNYVDAKADSMGYGISAYNLTIKGSGTLNVKGMREGVYTPNNMMIEDCTVTAESAAEQNSCLYALMGGITIKNARVEISSCGDAINANLNVTIEGGTVEADTTSEFNSGITTATGAVVIKEGSTLTASGGYNAIQGTVKNYIAGLGWTDVRGTGGATLIAPDPEGKTLDYLRVMFSDKAPAFVIPVSAVKGIAKGRTSLQFTWNKVNGAAKYEVWMAKCSKNAKYRKVKTLGTGKTTFTKKKLKKNTEYEYYVVAKNASGKVISKSAAGYAYTGNVRGKYTNAGSLKVTKSSFALTEGGKAKIKATQTKAKKGKKLCSRTALLRYTSNNPSVAKVSSNGTITAVGPGSCTVYVQTVNGIWKIVKVNVSI